MSQSADRNLLFGILALQLNFITRDQLVEGMHAWVLDKRKAIGEIFVAQKAMDGQQCTLLNALVDKHIEKHSGDVQKSLQQLSSVDPEATKVLQAINDSDLLATVVHLPNTASERPSLGEPTNRTPSRFRIIRPHARGGLGEVFVAQDTELSREVALKEIQGHYADNTDSRERFVREAEITGNLEHPGIVPVYGLGQYDDGRPYYAMRFVRGESLKEAIKSFHEKYKTKLTEGEAGLELRRLLRRLVDVCNAIAYAHSRGVLHRDLKPGNIILGRYGETLVVDWGLAKAQGQAETSDATLGPVVPTVNGETSPTLMGTAIGTPAYMSPEQAAGRVDELNETSDVYSLGATLFHLLTGEPPIAGNTALEVVSKAEAGDIRKLQELKSDLPKALAAVCSKAMAKAQSDRYSSPVALADDLEKWLADEPVGIYEEPLAVKARRWVRRHPAIVSALAVCVVLGLCVSLAVAYLNRAHASELASKNIEVTLAKDKAEAAMKAEQIAKEDAQDKQKIAESERKRAEQREEDAISAVKRFGDAVSNNKELKDNPKLQPLRTELLKEPLNFFKSLRQSLEAESNPRAASLARLGKAAFELAYLTNELGDMQDAITAFSEAIVLHERLVEDNPLVTSYQRDLALSYHNLGVLLVKTGKLEEALGIHEKAQTIRERLARDDPSNTSYQSDLAASYNNVGLLLEGTGKYAEAFAVQERAKVIRERLVKDNPTSNRYQSDLARSYHNQGILLSSMGKLDEALVAHMQAKVIQEQLVESDFSVSQYQSDLALSYNGIGRLLSITGKPEEAILVHEQSKTIRERLVADNPSVSEYQFGLARTYHNLGALFGDKGQRNEAFASYEQARAIRERLVKDNPTVTQYQNDLAISYVSLGNLLRDTGKTDEALAAYKRAKAIRERLAKDHPSVSQYQSELANIRLHVALEELQLLWKRTRDSAVRANGYDEGPVAIEASDK